MKTTLKNILLAAAILICITSCKKDEGDATPAFADEFAGVYIDLNGNTPDTIII